MSKLLVSTLALALVILGGCAAPPWRTSSPADSDIDITPESAIPKQIWTTNE